MSHTFTISFIISFTTITSNYIHALTIPFFKANPLKPTGPKARVRQFVRQQQGVELDRAGSSAIDVKNDVKNWHFLGADAWGILGLWQLCIGLVVERICYIQSSIDQPDFWAVETQKTNVGWIEMCFSQSYSRGELFAPDCCLRKSRRVYAEKFPKDMGWWKLGSMLMAHFIAVSYMIHCRK